MVTQRGGENFVFNCLLVKDNLWRSHKKKEKSFRLPRVDDYEKENIGRNDWSKAFVHVHLNANLAFLMSIKLSQEREFTAILLSQKFILLVR